MGFQQLVSLLIYDCNSDLRYSKILAIEKSQDGPIPVPTSNAVKSRAFVRDFILSTHKI